MTSAVGIVELTISLAFPNFLLLNIYLEGGRNQDYVGRSGVPNRAFAMSAETRLVWAVLPARGRLTNALREMRI
jgi:hypothetical protein